MQKVVVGIDFGSSGTGYAYSFNKADDIILGTFSGQGAGAKVPTEIILDSNLSVLAFGFKCEDYIKENKLIHEELHFKKVKMNLYSNNNFIVPENSSKKFHLYLIISKILEYIKEEAFKAVNAGIWDNKITKDDIKWVVTVPAIWNLSQKGIMIKACEKAGLFNNHTNIYNFFALEPEAASLYCSQDNVIDSSFLAPGRKYIICDLGGGTGDFVSHEINNKRKIIEIYRPIGGDYGSDEIDKKFFEKVIYKIFGIKDYLSLKQKNDELDKEDRWEENALYYEWVKFQKEISDYKKINKTSKNKTFFLNCSFFRSFIDIKLKNLVKNYNDSCQEGWNISVSPPAENWILSIPYKIFFDLINDHSAKISQKLGEIYDNIEDIDGVLYVGGFCSNEVLVDKLKYEFPQFRHLIPLRPIIAVVKGAVLFGIDQNIITVRKAKYTIGLGITTGWNENKHKGGTKVFNNVTKIYECTNAFDSFIKIGENIPIGKLIEKNYLTQDPRYCNLLFYKTMKDNPFLINEDGIDFLGEDKLDLGKNYNIGESIKVIMKFGGTFVEAKCIHQKSGVETKALPLYFEK